MNKKRRSWGDKKREKKEKNIDFFTYGEEEFDAVAYKMLNNEDSLVWFQSPVSLGIPPHIHLQYAVDFHLKREA
jgi:hypothetical protein